jgi:hypothetical protein
LPNQVVSSLDNYTNYRRNYFPFITSFAKPSILLKPHQIGDNIPSYKLSKCIYISKSLFFLQ